jgi:hypothetical protein
MSTTVALALLDGFARDHGASGSAVRTQAAFVRALVDEVDRRDASGGNVIALNEQLVEESHRLAEMLSCEK